MICAMCVKNNVKCLDVLRPNGGNGSAQASDHRIILQPLTIDNAKRIA